MGFSLKKVVKSVTQPIKKVSSVATSALAGFAGGGSVGALAGTVKGVVANTQTGQAASTTLGSVGTDIAIGAGANIAAGAALGGFNLVKSLPFFSGGGALNATGQVVPGIGEVASYDPTGGSFLSKAIAFGKSGGIAGNLGGMVNGIGNVLKKGGGVLASLFNKGGIVPGTTENAAQVNADQNSLGNKLLSGYRNLKDNVPQLGSLSTQIRKVATGSNPKEDLRAIFTGQNNPPAATIVNTPAVGNDSPNFLVLAGIGLLAFMFIKKK